MGLEDDVGGNWKETMGLGFFAGSKAGWLRTLVARRGRKNMRNM